MLALCLGTSSAGVAGEQSGVLRRISCPVVRYYVAKYSADAAEQWARTKGASDAEIEAARRCLQAGRDTNGQDPIKAARARHLRLVTGEASVPATKSQLVMAPAVNVAEAVRRFRGPRAIDMDQASGARAMSSFGAARLQQRLRRCFAVRLLSRGKSGVRSDAPGFRSARPSRLS